MKVHRFFCELVFEDDGRAAINDVLVIEQISKVLRLRPGSQVIICDGTGTELKCGILEMTKKMIRLSIDEKKKNNNESERRTTLYCAMVKKENFELVCQKATETGIHAIVPLLTERTIKLGLKIERVQKIVREAAEQAERGIIPKIHEPVGLKTVFSQAIPNTLRIMFDQSGQPWSACEEKLLKAQQVECFIGPEGGWTEPELDLAQQSGCLMVTLGPRVLRAETAAIVASYLINH